MMTGLTKMEDTQIDDVYLIEYIVESRDEHETNRRSNGQAKRKNITEAGNRIDSWLRTWRSS
jgi:hypothetical protein